ncbi:MAG: ABC transporter substrate-binding protein [bacterium]
MLRAALVTPLSGPLAGYGRAGAKALRLWAEWETGPVELTVVDAHPDPAAAVRAAEGQADVLFGPYGSGPTVAVADATDRLVWNHGGATVGGDRHVVSVLAPASSYFEGALQVVQQADPGLRDVTVLHHDSGFGRAVAAGAAAEAGRLGLEVAQRSLPGAEPVNGELLLVAGRFGDEVAVARRVPTGRWRAAAFVGAGVEEVLAELGVLREGLLGPAQWLPRAAPRPDVGPTAAEFVAAYRAAAGVEPPYPAAQAFAAGLVAARCVRRAGAADDAAVLAAARKLECTTLFGRFRLDPASGRQVGHRVLTVQWQDGARTVVGPPERAQAALRYPLAQRRYGATVPRCGGG